MKLRLIILALFTLFVASCEPVVKSEREVDLEQQAENMGWGFEVTVLVLDGHSVYWFERGGGDSGIGGPLHIAAECPKCKALAEEQSKSGKSDYEKVFGVEESNIWF